MVERKNVSTGNPWEKSVGFSRVVRCGDLVYTAGTIAADRQGVIHGNDCYSQCCYIFNKLRDAMSEVDCQLEDVVKVVAYLTDLADADGFTKAHHEYLGGTLPATTCVQVAGLFGDGALVELELTAISTDTSVSCL